ncbi:hypothetical protein [Metabacillus fastidiosus]|uniref:hypothetical protein n=1 Tax=Metabacillus fastidiosus TaxID=1458 RepID=UPI002DB6F1BA|nr:hypothetical protein [Metabacillus fastidiosus]MEC2077021.1 hypothetical protein [Metabacillus fastidiosus]
MAKCKCCDYEWKAREICSLGFAKDGKNCPSCGNRQYISSETQRIFTLGFLSLILIIIFPFIIKLSSEKEPLW